MADLGSDTSRAEEDGSRQQSKQRDMTIELPFLGLTEFPTQYAVASSHGFYSPSWVKTIILHHNQMKELPDCFAAFTNVVTLDLSNNGITELPESICELQHIKVIQMKNNQLDHLPRRFSLLTSLELLNISGNAFTEFPKQLALLTRLKALYMGANLLKDLPCALGDMQKLEMLYLGGNHLTDVPATIGKLMRLESLNLSDNRLDTIPSSIACLQRLRSLSLHKNQLKTLPPELVKLQNLQELSLRGNPLVVRFAREITFDPPSLKELAGRSVRVCKISTGPEILPPTLLDYLSSAHQCVNPKCKGVYFEARVEHVKFVDFCGKYRVPLMQYLCSPRCTSATPAYCLTSGGETSDSEVEDETRMRRVLLG